MTTVHHPPLKGVDFHDYHSWLWIGLSVVLVVLAITAIAWSMTNASVQDATFADSASVATADATPAQFDVSPGVTSAFVGANAGPDVVYTELDEATSPAIFDMKAGITPVFVGASAGPDVVYTELDEATSPAKFDIKPGVIAEFIGGNGDPDIE